MLALAVGMPLWLDALAPAASQQLASDAVAKMHVGPLLVPATGAPIRVPETFAFISPSLARHRDAALGTAALDPAVGEPPFRRSPRRRVVWRARAGSGDVATTALTFSNALRTFYSFIYRPVVETERELAHDTNGRPYFVRRLVFSHDVAPIFGPYLFAPLERFVVAVAVRLRIIQSGHLNFYLSLIGALLVVILIVAWLCSATIEDGRHTSPHRRMLPSR